METKFKEILNNRVSDRDKVIVAVSGGVDSVVLLDLFIKHHNQEEILVAHLNHGMRKEAEFDEKFVQSLAKKYGVGYCSKKLVLKGKSEDVARKARYLFLRDLLAKNNAKYIVTAHHLNDQAETLILNLIRGTGPLNVWGMKEVESAIFRPMLNFSKKEILTYARKRKLKWVEDKSNKDLSYSRNLVRNKVIPVLTGVNPNLLKCVKSEIELGQTAAEEFEKIAEKKEKRAVSGNVIDIKELRKLSPFMQRLLIYRAISRMLNRTENIYRKNIDAVFALLSSPGTKKTVLGTFTIEKNYDKIIFSPKNSSTIREKKIIPGKSYQFGNLTLKTGFSAGRSRKNNILISPEIAYNLRVRSFRTGDKIKTSAGTKKLSDVFTDAKVNVRERGCWPVVTAGTEILWVPMLAASTKALKSSKDKVLIIEVAK